ncbi:MAG: ATP-dependent DNA helicase RecG [Crocinitomicaceae bacterium]
MNDKWKTPIEFLKGVGPKRAELLKKEIGIHSFQDLLYYFPFRYVDRSVFHQVAEIPEMSAPVQLKGRITGLREEGIGRRKRLVANFQDNSGMIQLVWFKGVQWIKNSIKVNETIVVYGKAAQFGAKWNIPHPEMTPIQKHETGLQPVYPSTEKLSASGMDAKGLHKLQRGLKEQMPIKFEDWLPQNVLQENRLISRDQAMQWVHFPKTEEQAEAAKLRLKFEELLMLQLELLVRKKIALTKSEGFVYDRVGAHFNTFYEKYLPFELTGAQKRVLKEIRSDMTTGHHMNRLLQGDVGSGKTLVALLTMLLALDNGFQAALMAPTEILAIQHFESLKEFLSGMDIKIGLLTGSTRKKDRTILHEALQNGEMQLLIGTHALLEDTVQFKNLGLVVIDEQHRFGVAQRARMWRKNTTPPHVLIMTATPIPRTLAMTFYGDLDVSVIDELPPGRKPITTVHKKDAQRLRVFGFMREEIAKGRQVYIVYPLIHESEKLDFNNLMDGYEAIQRAFPLPEYRVSIVHGQQKPKDKEFEMNRFVRGETQIMVATTVIEVGVNVPNASVMIIESAERFGLSQLHQLRGRVGRGAEKSFCILMTGDKISPDTKKRVNTMVRTNDGFEIAEVDLQLRGPGDLMGTQQSGILDLKIANLARDGHLVALARKVATEILREDPNLEMEKHTGLRSQLVHALKSRPDWGKIA